MANTVVGLFENKELANKVAGELDASGFARDQIRVLSEPLDMTVTSVVSTPGTDFSLALFRSLRDIGATEDETNAYVLGVRQGGVLVFATGSPKQVDAGVEIMNRHKAAEVEALTGLEPILPNAARPNVSLAHGPLNSTVRIRYSGEGARIFVW